MAEPVPTPDCPVHGSALCPEDYMLRPDGKPWAHYAEHWDESMRCGLRHRSAVPTPECSLHGTPQRDRLVAAAELAGVDPQLLPDLGFGTPTPDTPSAHEPVRHAGWVHDEGTIRYEGSGDLRNVLGGLVWVPDRSDFVMAAGLVRCVTDAAALAGVVAERDQFERERDEARAERADLRAEIDGLRGALAEAEAHWNQAENSHMESLLNAEAERDRYRDALATGVRIVGPYTNPANEGPPLEIGRRALVAWRRKARKLIEGNPDA